jgi:hypothetical protein
MVYFRRRCFQKAFVCTWLLFSVFPAQAQKKENEKVRWPLCQRFIKADLKTFRTKLSLSSEQVEEFELLYDDIESVLREIRQLEREGVPARDLENDLLQIKTDVLKECLEILDEKQKKQLLRDFRFRKINRKNLFNAVYLKDFLNLTEEQYLKLRNDILRGVELDYRALYRSYSSSKEKLYSEIFNLTLEVGRDVEKILDIEQMKKFRALLLSELKKHSRNYFKIKFQWANIGKLKKNLNLDDEQIAVSKALLKFYEVKIKNIPVEKLMNFESCRDYFMNLRDLLSESLKRNLNEAQQLLFEKILSKSKEKKTLKVSDHTENHEAKHD